MPIDQPFNFKVGFEAQKIRRVPKGTADFNYKAFLFELTQDILRNATRILPLSRRDG